jgi:DNA modification methylase
MKTVDLPLNHILHGECIETLVEFPENSIDVIFADPPYNLQLSQALYRPNLTKVDPVDDSWDKFKNFTEYDAFTCSWLTACRRVLKDTGTLWVIGTYHNIYRVGAILQDSGFWILNDVVWTKSNPMPQFRGVRFANAHETLIWAQKKKGAKYTFNYRAMKALNDDLQMRSDWTLPLATGKERAKTNGSKAHSAQKPEALLYRVILASSNPGDVILDPFFGTGTTGAVAKRLGRHWIGIEKDRKYIKVAQKRIDAVKAAPLEAVTLPNPRQQKRIPFGALLETGALEPGQKLFFAKDGHTAMILANGQIKSGKIVGSIHGVAKLLAEAPCNGWEMWFYDDGRGERRPIDFLRRRLREQEASE